VLHQIALCIKDVHEATLRFVQGSERHPDVAIYGLNSVVGLNFVPGRQRSLPKVQFFIALTNQLQNRRCGIWCKAEMSHYPRLFSDNARVALPLSEPSADGKRGCRCCIS
jgi:hypothetical protein